MKKYTSYVNVFQGNGEIALPKPEGIAAAWYFIKAQCGNTFPHAALPFSKMTVGAYSGAYPTGYGVNDANYCGKVPKMYGEKCFCGFSHLHHSGTGAVGYYYNYALTAPFYSELSEAFARHESPDGRDRTPGLLQCKKGRRRHSLRGVGDRKRKCRTPLHIPSGKRKNCRRFREQRTIGQGNAALCDVRKG